MGAIEIFLNKKPDFITPLDRKAREAFLEISKSVNHIRQRTAQSFFVQLRHLVEAINDDPFRDTILRDAILLSRCNWTLVEPFLASVRFVSEDAEQMAGWTRLALDIGEKDVDAAAAFLDLTQKAFANLGKEQLFQWGGQAVEALQTDRKRMWRTVIAYLEESAADRCAYPLSRWQFFLAQAGHIAKSSTAAAEAFMRLGNKVCLMLDDEEIRQWIAAGLEAGGTEEEVINYFSGISLKSIETRDGIVTGLSLKECTNTLLLICEALLGKAVKIRSNTAIVGQKGFAGGAATDGRTIFLPEVAPEFGTFKLMAMHQLMLMDTSLYQPATVIGHMAYDPVSIHVAADRKLLERLPGLRSDMVSQMGEDRLKSYPERLDSDLHPPLPWWGDLLPDLILETDATIERLKEKAADEYGELPPELAETLLAAMMAEGNRDRDGLWAMLEEMLNTMVLTSPDAEELAENVKTFFYKEWDANQSDYKLDWCLVRQRKADSEFNPFANDVCERLSGLIKLIRRQFLCLKPERFRKFRAQPTGDGLDIDALVAAVADMRSGAGLSENVYVRRDKRIRDVAVLFLVDLSISTEEKINGRRVIDIQKEAMILMAEALDALEDPFAIYGFSSEGRFRVDLFRVKDFGEAYGPDVKNRLGNLEPLGLTRMGAVIRHATHKLEASPAAIKLMIILTDGRPYDLEYGYLDYAIADTKKAIQESRRKGIHPFIITSDKKGEDYLKRISPETGSIILPKVELLPTLLPAVYKRLTV